MKFGAPDCFILGRGLRKFLAASSTTMESLPLKELDFGLQKPTGPSSGVVASIVLIKIALSSVSFLFFYATHTPFRLYLVNYKILVLRTTFLKIRIVVKKIIKNPNLVIKL